MWLLIKDKVRKFDNLVALVSRGRIFTHYLKRQVNAPIAQWIERYPPEVETCVRVAVGVLTETLVEQPPSLLFTAFACEAREKR